MCHCAEWPHRHGWGWRCHCGEDCEDHGTVRRFGRRFLTREERINRLEEYLQALRAEAQAVEEHIAELKAAQ